MKLHIIIIGDEILLGRVVDTNSSLIAQTFTNLGWDIDGITTVGDDGAAIADAVRRALGAADMVVTTGGLGPTRDDITKKVLMDIFGGHLEEDAAVLANVERIFAERGIAMNDLTRTQALVPTSCRVIQNRLGTAPIMWFESTDHQPGHPAKVLVAMPGVPFETRGMIGEVSRQAGAHFMPRGHFHRGELTVAGISESALAERLVDFENSLPEGSHLAYLPSPGRVLLRLDVKDRPAVDFDRFMASLRQAVGAYCIGEGCLSPAEILIAHLRSRSLTMATAESCTGGNIAHTITAIAGCSDVYRGGVVSYCNEVKQSVLGVPAEAFADGAVSEPVVRAMAEGACRVCGADCAVATSGIAGPGGAVPGKPVGTVWIAASVQGRTEARLFHIAGDRAAVIDGATARALNMLRELIVGQ